MLIISDLHWRTDTPSWRKEKDYAKEVLRPMLGAMLDTGEDIIICGDVFHRSANFKDTYDLFTFLNEWEVPPASIYAVRGQHDMVNHTNSDTNTGFNLLAQASLIAPLDPAWTSIEGHTVVYGMGWGEDMPTAAGDNDILIAHISISHGNAVIPGASTATAFAQQAKEHGFGMVFTGDNHKRFSIPELGLYNAGCFHQMTSDLEDQPPAAWHVLPNGEVDLWPIPGPEPLIDLSYKMGAKKGQGVAGTEFVKALSEARQNGGGDVFLEALKKAASEETGEVKGLLDEVVKQCEEVHG